MTKKEFIQLAIRTCGIILLITSLGSIIRAISIGLAILFILPVSDSSGFITTLVLAGQLITPSIAIIVIVYLLFGGRIIAKIVDRNSSLELESSLLKENYSEILIRFIGIWWLWKTLSQIFSVIYSLLVGSLLNHPQWVLGHLDKPDESIEKLQELIHPMQEHFSGCL